MEPMEVVAVVGSCGPERLRCATRLAAASRRAFLGSADLDVVESVGQAVDRLRWQRHARGAVVEFPAETDVVELIGAAAAADSPIRLVDIVCVVDAEHLLDGFERDDYVTKNHEQDLEMTAAALLIARQIEYASAIVLVNWMEVPTALLATLLALVSHLGPLAHLSLHDDDPASLLTGTPFEAGQDRPGWVQLINREFRPRMTDSRVGTLHYEHLRPLHPVRMERLLYTIESGVFGNVIRSVGFCRLATRPNIVAQWDHVGRMVALVPLVIDGQLGADDELLSIGPELVFIGLDLDIDGLRAALDDAVLGDAEFAAGPTTWAEFADPFPPWQVTSEQAD